MLINYCDICGQPIKNHLFILSLVDVEKMENRYNAISEMYSNMHKDWESDDDSDEEKFNNLDTNEKKYVLQKDICENCYKLLLKFFEVRKGTVKDTLKEIEKSLGG